LVVLFSDMMDDQSVDRREEIFNALQHLRHNKHEVVLFHVLDKKTEMDFQFENRPYTFVDPESGEEIKLNPADIREQYKTAASAYYDELKSKCTQYHIDFVLADIEEGFNQILTEYLIKRKRIT